MKKILSIKLFSMLLMVLICFLASSNICLADNGITIKIDGQAVAFDVSPQIINNRTMVPMRKIFETLGATVEWDQNTKTVTSTKGGTTVSLTIDNPKMSVNGNIVTLDTPACIIDNRTLVPVRAIAEAFQTEVNWDEGTKTVSISCNGTSNVEKGNTNPYEVLKDYIIKNGDKTSSGEYEIYFTPTKVLISVVNYDSVSNKLKFSDIFPEGFIVLTLQENEYPKVSAMINKGVNKGVYGGVYTPELTGALAPSQGVIYRINKSYQCWDSALQARGLNIKIRDFGIAY